MPALNVRDLSLQSCEKLAFQHSCDYMRVSYNVDFASYATEHCLNR
jgi:hypothetical protein